MTTSAPTRQPGRLERRKARTRAAILSSASDLFRSRGYDTTSIQDIAEAADAGVGTLYGYFAAKDDILRAVLEAHADEAVQRYWAGIDETTNTLERLVAAIRSLAEYIRDNRRILLAAFGAAARSRPVDEESSKWLLKSYERLLREGIERGEIGDVPVETTARVLISACHNAMLRIAVWENYQDDDATIRDLEAFARRALRA
ncbi:MAG: TetR/AcrR family transcriptional regulator [Dehalococcoidia bacterium]